MFCSDHTILLFVAILPLFIPSCSANCLNGSVKFHILSVVQVTEANNNFLEPSGILENAQVWAVMDAAVRWHNDNTFGPEGICLVMDSVASNAEDFDAVALHSWSAKADGYLLAIWGMLSSGLLDYALQSILLNMDQTSDDDKYSIPVAILSFYSQNKYLCNENHFLKDAPPCWSYRNDFVSDFETASKGGSFIPSVPSSDLMAQAIVDFLSFYNWTLIAVIHDTSGYGNDLRDSLTNIGSHLLIDQYIPVSGTSTDRMDCYSFNGIDFAINALEQNTEARIIVVFLSRNLANRFFERLNNRSSFHREYLFICSDEALRAISVHVVDSGDDQVFQSKLQEYPGLSGSIFTQATLKDDHWLQKMGALLSNESYGVLQHENSVSASVARNIMETFSDCSSDSGVAPNCTFSIDQQWLADSITYVMRMIDTFLYTTLTKVQQNRKLYNSTTFDLFREGGPLSDFWYYSCYFLAPIIRDMRNMTANMLPSVHYTFYQYQRHNASHMATVEVGDVSYNQYLNQSILTLSEDIIEFRASVKSAIQKSLASCNTSCEPGNITYKGPGYVCVYCDTCKSPFDAIIDSRCMMCGEFTKPNGNYSECISASIRREMITKTNLPAIICPAVIGIILILISITILIVNQNTPVVKIAGFRMLIAVSISLLGLFSISLLAAFDITESICVTLWAGVAVLTSTTSTALLAKLQIYAGLLRLRVTRTKGKRSRFCVLILWMVLNAIQVAILICVVVFNGARISYEQRANDGLYYVAICGLFDKISLSLIAFPIIILGVVSVLTLHLNNLSVNYVHREIILILVYSMINLVATSILIPPSTIGVYTTGPEDRPLWLLAYALVLGYLQLLLLIFPTVQVITFKPYRNSIFWVTQRRRLRYPKGGTSRVIRLEQKENQQDIPEEVSNGLELQRRNARKRATCP